MTADFGVDFFRGNRQRLTKLFAGKAPIVLTAHGRMQSSVDETLPFRQDSNFWYLTGINEPDILLVLDKAKEYLVLPEYYDHHIRWAGAATIDQLRQASGIDEILTYKDGWRVLKPRLKKSKHFATLAAAPNYIPTHGFYTNPARADLLNRVKAINPQIEPLDLRQHFVAMRTIKQPIEVEAIRQAVDITIKSVKILQKRGWHKLESEQHLSNELEYQFGKNGADGVGFDTVVGAGRNASVPHWQGDKSVISKQGFLVLDLGAKVGMYSADVARTYPLSRPTKRMRQVYQAVLDAREHALGLLKPGVVLSEYETAMEQFIGEKLRELGLIKTLERKDIRAFFPHYTSHQLGIDVHDLHSDEDVLQPGMVLTVEPGIYIPKEGLGVRIEDDLYVSDQGLENLSSGLPINLS